MKFEIKSRWTGSVIFTFETTSLRLAVEAGVKSGVDLHGANLSGADLYEADLRGANLHGADLHGANLRYADLHGANLSGADLYEADLHGANLSGADLYEADLHGANLHGADLHGANLRGANLHGADLHGANLHGADLHGANLRGANLHGADLHGANLSGADLYEADLRGANLHGADLYEADLRGANLHGADLTPIRDDLWAVLSASPAEVLGLRAAIAEGRINGSSYEGACACLVGTLANVRHCDYEQLPLVKPNSSRPVERFFLAIETGDTPATSEFSKLALEWVDIWLANMHSAFAGKP